MKKIMVRYPHGYYRGGAWENEYSPTLTTSAWEFNNYVLEIDCHDGDDAGAERGGETP
jgi:hypothetical protein